MVPSPLSNPRQEGGKGTQWWFCPLQTDQYFKEFLKIYSCRHKILLLKARTQFFSMTFCFYLQIFRTAVQKKYPWASQQQSLLWDLLSEGLCWEIYHSHYSLGTMLRLLQLKCPPQECCQHANRDDIWKTVLHTQ